VPNTEKPAIWKVTMPAGITLSYLFPQPFQIILTAPDNGQRNHFRNIIAMKLLDQGNNRVQAVCPGLDD